MISERSAPAGVYVRVQGRAMRQSKLVVQQTFNRPLRVADLRRKNWAPRRLRRTQPLDTSEMLSREYIPGEFDEPARYPAVSVLRRSVGLASDMTLLLLLSPFFAVWGLYRLGVRLKRARR
jgi:hypothetical protein